MKKYFLLVLILAIVPFFSYAQGEENNQEEQHNEQEEGQPTSDEQTELLSAKSLFWEVTRDDVQPFYIYGTIHIISVEDFELPETLIEKMNEVNKVVFELDMDDDDMQTEFLKHLPMEGQTLDQLLGEEDYKKATDFFKEKGNIDLANFNNIKPFFINSLLYTLLLDGETTSYEQALLELAQSSGKEIEGLETVAFQMGVFDKISLKEQANMLMDYVNDFEKQKKLFNQMIETYKAKDPEALYKFMMQNMEEYKQYEDVLLNDRNEAWIEQMREIVVEQPTLFAVGAGHLGGDMGLLQRLRQEGYTVKPVGQDQ